MVLNIHLNVQNVGVCNNLIVLSTILPLGGDPQDMIFLVLILLTNDIFRIFFLKNCSIDVLYIKKL